MGFWTPGDDHMALRSLTTSALRAEIARRERGAGKLLKRRAKLQKQLDGLLAELADLGVDGTAKRRGRPPGRRGPGRPKGSKNRGPGRPKGSKNRKPGRPAGSKNRKLGRPKGKRAKNEMSLAEAVSQVVRVGKTVSPAEVMGAVRKVYKSSSKNLGMMVANTLAKHPHFKRLGRGQYLHKGGGKAKAAPGKRKARRSGRKGRKASAAAPSA